MSSIEQVFYLVCPVCSTSGAELRAYVRDGARRSVFVISYACENGCRVSDNELLKRVGLKS